MLKLKKLLRKRLEGARRIAVLGVGSELRGDDAAGIRVAENVKKFRKPFLKAFIGATAPENLTGEIKKFKPTHLLIVDTAQIQKKPGTILLLSPEEVGTGVSFSTHKLPVLVMINYLRKTFECEVTIIGIQPETLDFGLPLSKVVAKAVKDVTAAILEYI